MGKIIKNGIEYSGNGASNASELLYDNSSSDLNAINVQNAIDELKEINDSIAFDVETNISNIAENTASITEINNAVTTNTNNITTNTNAITKLNDSMVHTKQISTGLDTSDITTIIDYVHNFLKDGQSISANVAYSTNSSFIVGKRISSTRGRYLMMPRTSIVAYNVIKKDDTITVEQISLSSHNHDDKYLTLSGGTMSGHILWKFASGGELGFTKQSNNKIFNLYYKKKDGSSWTNTVFDVYENSDSTNITSNFNGNAASASKLETERNFQVNLSSASASSFNGTANCNPGVTGTLPIANGGTGATTAANALKNLGVTATAAELNYCDGVTSNIQTQLNAKSNALEIVRSISKTIKTAIVIGSTYSFSIPISKSGYTPIAISCLSLSSTSLCPVSWTFTNSTATIYCVGLSTLTSQNITCGVDVLYVKN